MKTLLPASGLSTLRKELDRLFDRIWEGGVPESMTPLGEWVPSVDLSELPEAVIVKAEVPGIDPKDIHVTLNEQLLTISGEKKFEKETKEEKVYRLERASGSFSRSIPIPVAVDPSKVTALFRHGLLTVTMPKTDAARGTMIPIRSE